MKIIDKKEMIYCILIINTILILLIYQSNFSQKYFFCDRIFKHLLPQEWGFFTENPLDFQYHWYQKTNDIWQEVTLNNNCQDTYYGLSRYKQVQALEAKKLLSNLNDRDWEIQTDSFPFTMQICNFNVIKIKNNSKINTIEGLFVVKRVMISPYGSVQNTTNTFSVISILK